MAATFNRTFQDAKRLSVAEKWALIRGLLSELSPTTFLPPGAGTIQATPGVAGGRPRVANTRIPVSHVVYYLNAGITSDKIIEMFPSLHLVDIQAVKAYYAANKQAVDAEIAEEE